MRCPVCKAELSLEHKPPANRFIVRIDGPNNAEREALIDELISGTPGRWTRHLPGELSVDR